MTYDDKEILNIEELIKLLESRWLIINDKIKAKHYLSQIWYYRLSWYFKYFQNWENDFKKWTTFKQVLDIYRFDKQLRLLLLDLLERIESSLKTCFVDSIWLCFNDKYFIYDNNSYKNTKGFDLTLEYIENEIKRVSKSEIMIKHWEEYEKICKIPIWILVNILSFGTVVRILLNLSNSSRKALKKCYWIKIWILLSWFVWLNDLRNYCAHHNRVWNRRMKQIRTSEIFEWYSIRSSLFAYLIVINYFINIISPNSEWKTRLIDLIDKYSINIKEMWFPDNWKEILWIK